MKKTFTILHTNDMHSAFIGMGPASDYTPFELNNDKTRGGYARLAGLIAQRKAVYRIRSLFCCSTRAITALGPRLALPLAKSAANTTPPPSDTMISISGRTAWEGQSAPPPKPPGFRR